MAVEGWLMAARGRQQRPILHGYIMEAVYESYGGGYIHVYCTVPLLHILSADDTGQEMVARVFVKLMIPRTFM